MTTTNNNRPKKQKTPQTDFFEDSRELGAMESNINNKFAQKELDASEVTIELKSKRKNPLEFGPVTWVPGDGLLLIPDEASVNRKKGRLAAIKRTLLRGVIFAPNDKSGQIKNTKRKKKKDKSNAIPRGRNGGWHEYEVEGAIEDLVQVNEGEPPQSYAMILLQLLRNLAEDESREVPTAWFRRVYNGDLRHLGVSNPAPWVDATRTAFVEMIKQFPEKRWPGEDDQEGKHGHRDEPGKGNPADCAGDGPPKRNGDDQSPSTTKKQKFCVPVSAHRQISFSSICGTQNCAQEHSNDCGFCYDCHYTNVSHDDVALTVVRSPPGCSGHAQINPYREPPVREPPRAFNVGDQTWCDVHRFNASKHLLPGTENVLQQMESGFILCVGYHDKETGLTDIQIGMTETCSVDEHKNRVFEVTAAWALREELASNPREITRVENLRGLPNAFTVNIVDCYPFDLSESKFDRGRDAPRNLGLARKVLVVPWAATLKTASLYAAKICQRLAKNRCNPDKISVILILHRDHAVSVIQKVRNKKAQEEQYRRSCDPRTAHSHKMTTRFQPIPIQIGPCHCSSNRPKDFKCHLKTRNGEKMLDRHGDDSRGFGTHIFRPSS